MVDVDFKFFGRRRSQPKRLKTPLHPFGLLLSSMNSFDRSFPSAIVNVKLSPITNENIINEHLSFFRFLKSKFTFALPHDPETPPP